MEKHWLIIGRYLLVGSERVAAMEAQADDMAAVDAEAQTMDEEVQAAEDVVSGGAEAEAEDVVSGGADAEHAASMPEDAMDESEEVRAAKDVVSGGAEAEDVVSGGADAEAKYVVSGGADTEAEHAASVPEDAISILVAPPPRISVLAVGRGVHPDPNKPDICPYMLAACPHGLLLHFQGPPPSHGDHLVVARPRRFNRTDEQSTFVLSTEPIPSQFPIRWQRLESFAFACNESGGYMIAELQIHWRTNRATMMQFNSGDNIWFTIPMPNPLPVQNRKWTTHGTVSIFGMLWWFDLSWGIISYDSGCNNPLQSLTFHELPHGRTLIGDEATKQIQRKRCVAVSQNKILYVEIIPTGEAATLWMWSRSRVQGGWQWEEMNVMSFEEIWGDESYKRTELPRNVPVLVIVCPYDPGLVYFSLEEHIFGVNVPARKVAHYEAYKLLHSHTASSRYVAAWSFQSQPSMAPALGMNPSSFHTGQVATEIGSNTVNICEVWCDGLEAAFEEIGTILKDKGDERYLVAFDTEFAVPNNIEKSEGEPRNPDGHYHQLCTYVNRGDLVQVGLGFADKEYNLVGEKMFQFNIQFDPESRDPDHKGVHFMLKSGLKLGEHAKRGIKAERFMELLSASGVLRNDKLSWITFMGYIDFGFLIKLLRGKDLPASREHFLNEFRETFPSSYDCKVFSKFGKCIKEPVPGKLAYVASKLGVKQEGDGHQAASDALLTLRCHQKMMSMKPDFAAKICAVLYGVCVLTDL